MESWAIRWTNDPRVIKRLALDPSIFPHICDDFTDTPEKWVMPKIDSRYVRCLIGTDDEGPFGFGIFHARTHICWEGHFGFLPRSYGSKSLHAFKQMIMWMWLNTSARRIVGEIVVENKRAISFAKRAGFQVYGINMLSFVKHGQLQHQVCLGISKP